MIFIVLLILDKVKVCLHIKNKNCKIVVLIISYLHNIQPIRYFLGDFFAIKIHN